MIRPILLGVFLVMMIFSSCKKSAENLSKINVNEIENFILRSIQKGADDQTNCIGYLKGSNQTVVLQYDKAQRLLKKTNLSLLNPDFAGNLKVTCLKERGWLISNFVGGKTPVLSVFHTDRSFAIINETRKYYTGVFSPGYSDSGMALTVRDLKPLKNGDFIMTLDTAPWWTVGGIAIMRFDPQLKPIFSFSQFRSLDPGIYFKFTFPLHVIEMEDESLFFSFTTEVLLSIFERNTGIVSGLMSKEGSIVYQHLSNYDKQLNYPIALSAFGKNMLSNTLVNNEALYYNLLDPLSGKVINEAFLPYTERNHQIIYGAYKYPDPDLSIIGEANELVQLPNGSLGQLIYAKNLKNLYFLEVDPQLNLTKTFSILLPEFTEVNSYRQLLTKDGTLLVGTSYSYNGKNYFNLQELTLDGKVVN